MNRFKKNTGITLIALVITIIVLLILAGVAIATLFGENGILSKANQSKEQNEKAKIIELAQTDILAKKAENYGNLSEDDLVEVLTSTDYNTQGTLSNEESVLDRTLTTKDGKYEIAVSEIYNSTLNESKKAPIYFGGKSLENVVVGDDFTIGYRRTRATRLEKFEVIKKEGNLITALPYYNITLTVNNPVQRGGSGITHFCNSSINHSRNSRYGK